MSHCGISDMENLVYVLNKHQVFPFSLFEALVEHKMC